MSDDNRHEVRDVLVTAALVGGAVYIGRKHPLVGYGLFAFFGLVFGILFLVSGMWGAFLWSVGIPVVVISLDLAWRQGCETKSKQVEFTNWDTARQQRLMSYKKAGSRVCPSCGNTVFPSDECFYCGNLLR